MFTKMIRVLILCSVLFVGVSISAPRPVTADVVISSTSELPPDAQYVGRYTDSQGRVWDRYYSPSEDEFYNQLIWGS